MFDRCMGYEKFLHGVTSLMPFVPFAVRLSKESAQGAHNLGTEDHQVDNHDTDEHHHGVTLDFLGAFGGFFFQIILLNLPHIEREHLKVHLLIVTAQCADQPPDDIR